jgi:hypothetical protein
LFVIFLYISKMKNLYFNRNESDPLKKLGIGMRTMFGFGINLDDISSNNGIKMLYVTPEFGEKIWAEEDTKEEDFFYARYGLLRKKGYRNPITGKIISKKLPYKCYIEWEQILINGKILWKSRGLAGNKGFGGGENSKKEKLCKTYIKQCLEQVYYHLEELEIESNKVK